MQPLRIPLSDGATEVVIVTAAELPEDAGALVKLLMRENAQLPVWLRTAVAYRSVGRAPQFEQLLERAQQTRSFMTAEGEEGDMVAILNALAAHHVEIAAKGAGAADGVDHKAKATVLYNKSATLVEQVDKTWVGQGLLCLLPDKDKEGQPDLMRAVGNFENALAVDEQSIPAKLGMARLCFQQGKYLEALRLYAEALRLKPDCSPAVRLGLAHCHWRRGNVVLARKAFERVLELDPDNTDAIVGLGVLELSSEAPDAERVPRGMGFIKHARDSAHGDTNALVLNHLANHYFLRGDYVKTNELAKRAFHLSKNPLIKAESCFHYARGLHAEEKYDSAFNLYKESVKQCDFAGNKTFVLPHFGLGQLYIHRWLDAAADLNDAITHFEIVLKAQPKNLETLQILGWLYSETGKDKSSGLYKWGGTRVEKAVRMLTMAIEMDSDPQTQKQTRLELAQVLEQNPAKTDAAIKEYEAVTKSGDDEEAEMLNNVGVLYHRSALAATSASLLTNSAAEQKSQQEEAKQKLGTAKGMFELSLEGEVGEWKREDGSLQLNARHVTSAFNLARVHESLEEWDDAKGLYEAITALFPMYNDAWLRLGIMARNSGETETAKEYFSQACERAPEDVNVRTLMGTLAMQIDKLGDAQKVFERIIKEIDKDDPYAHVALGNIYHATGASAAKHASHKEDAKVKEKKYLKYALMIYRKAFHGDGENMYAANGIGMVLAEQGEYEQARKVFGRVRENTSEMPDIFINLGHCCFLLGMHGEAIKLYTNCLKRVSTGSEVRCTPSMGTIHQYIAKAHFDCGHFAECKEALQQALQVEPDNFLLHYNMGVCRLHGAGAILSAEHPTTEEVIAAQLDLDEAKRVFTWLTSQQVDEKELGFKMAKAGAHVNTCDAKRHASVQKLATAEARLADEIKAREEKERHVASRKEEQRAKKEQEEAAESAAKAERERIAAEATAKNERIIEELKAKAVAKPKAERPKGQKRKKSAATRQGGADDEAQPRAKTSRTASKKDMSIDDFLDDDSSSDEEPALRMDQSGGLGAESALEAIKQRADAAQQSASEEVASPKSGGRLQKHGGGDADAELENAIVEESESAEAAERAAAPAAKRAHVLASDSESD